MKKTWKLDDILPIGQFGNLYREIENDLEKMRKYVGELKPDISKEKCKEILEC